jgi:hypothetical protein
MPTTLTVPKPKKVNGQSLKLKSTEDALAMIDRALTALSKSEDLGDVKSIRDTAEALRHHAINVKASLLLQNRATELKLRAERRAGDILSAMRLRGGDRVSDSAADRIKLAEYGITHSQSARWQLEASLPEEAFTAFVNEVVEAGKELSSAALLRVVARHKTNAKRSDPVEALADETEPMEDAAESDRQLDTPHDAITEIRNHIKTLCDLIAPLCHAARTTPVEPFVSRAVHRLFREIHKSLSDLEQMVASDQSPQEHN